MDSTKTAMTLQDAAQLLLGPQISLHDAEVILARAIEHGELTANVKRWATEQWEGRQLPGNINRRETFIEPAALATWRQTAAV
jgi:hypothetical protein